MSWREPRARLALWTLLIVLAVVPWTDIQTHSHWPRVQWIPFVTPPIRLIDIVINVLLYFPFGYWFVRQAPGDQSWLRACFYALTLSLLTEWTQLYSHSRFPSLTDTTCNLIGTVIGARAVLRSHSAAPVEGGIS